MPTTPEIDAVLAATLDDRRLSRSEKRALGEVLAEHAGKGQALALYRHRAFEMARAELDRKEDRDTLDWLEDIVRALANAESATETPPSLMADALFSPGEEPLRRIIALLEHARHSVDICVFTVTDDRISRAIYAAHKRGVTVRVLTDNDKASDRGSDVDRLDRQGINVVVDDSPAHMHHKFAIFDNKVLLSGSYNWTRSAARANSENILVTDDARLVKRFREHFEDIWLEFSKG